MLQKIFLHSRMWRYGFSHPIYVPAELHHIRLSISEGRISPAMDELWKLARLGSDSAAATLDYMCLRGPMAVHLDSELIEKRCREAAIRRNGHAEYVVACRAYQQGNFKDYAKWLHRSAKEDFKPAIGDIGRIIMQGPKRSARTKAVAKKCFRRAIAGGHLISIVYFLLVCKKGRFGWVYRIFGTVVLPIAIAFTTPICLLCPFSISVFTHPARAKERLFTQK